MAAKVIRRVHFKNSEFSAFGCPVSLNSELSTLSLAFSQSFRLSEFSRWRERSFGGSALQGRRPFNDRFRPSACFNDYGGMSCGPPYGNLARTHARTHTTACKALSKPKTHAAGAFSHTNHRQNAARRERTRPAAPARAAASSGHSATAGGATETPHDTSTQALRTARPGATRRGSRGFAHTRARARRASRS